MGNLYTIHADIRRVIFRNYLDKVDRALLLWALNIKVPLENSFINKIAYKGNLPLTQWLHKNGCPYDGFTSAYAALGGHLEILQWLKNNGCPCNILTCIHASMNGHLNILEWAVNNGCYYDGWCAKYAYDRGHLEVLRWWYEKQIWKQHRDCKEDDIRNWIADLENNPHKRGRRLIV